MPGGGDVSLINLAVSCNAAVRPFSKSLEAKHVSGSAVIQLVSGIYLLPPIVRLFNHPSNFEVNRHLCLSS